LITTESELILSIEGGELNPPRRDAAVAQG
jgi:hypothetical protein